MNCKNCQTELTSQISFCNKCGGKVIRNRLTLKNLFASFSEQFFNYDNKLLQTFIMLFKRPEDVIGGYIDGTRKKYVNVISYFAIAITVAGLQMFFINKFYPEAIDFSFMSSLPGQEGMEEMQKENMSFAQEYQSVLMMLYVPLYALMAWITFIGIKKFNYTELLVIFMYIQAQISIAGAIIAIIAVVLGANFIAFSFFMILLMILYSAYCLKRLYNLSPAEIILRTLIFLIILGVIFVLFSIVAGVIMYLNGDMEAIQEAKKQAIEAKKATSGS